MNTYFHQVKTAKFSKKKKQALFDSVYAEILLCIENGNWGTDTLSSLITRVSRSF